MTQDSASDRPSAANETAKLGERLAREREAQGLSVAQVAAYLRITETYVGYLERDQLAKLPGRIYVRGYITSYAKLLSIPQAELLAALDVLAPPEETSHHSVKTTPLGPLGNIKPQVKPSDPLIRGISYLVLALIIVFSLLWWHSLQDDPSGTAALGDGPALDAGSGSQSLSPVTGRTGRQDARATESEPVVVGQSSENQAPQSDIAPSSANAVEDGTVAAAAPSREEREDTQGGSVAADGAAIDEAAIAVTNEVTINFIGTSWVEVRDAQGDILFTGVKEPGEVLQLRSVVFNIVIGNAAAVTLSYNGAPVDLAPHTNRRNVAQLEFGL